MAKKFSRSKKRQDIITKILAYTVLIIACLLVILPFSIVLSTSFKTHKDSITIPFKFYLGYLNFDYYKMILKDSDIWIGLKNTLIVVLPIMVTGVFFSALSAFSFSKLKFFLI